MIFDYVTPEQPTEAVDGYVATHWGTTNTMRARAMPTDRASNAQVYARNLITALSMTWELELTDAQRIAWGAYAYNSPLTSSWFTPNFINGYSHFLRSNRPRRQLGLPIIIDAPATNGLAEYNVPRMWITPGIPVLNIGLVPSDDWANTDGGYLLLWYSRPASPTKLTNPEKYRPMGTIAGATAGISSYATLALPADWKPSPQQQWIRTSATNADGRLSETGTAL